jgi:UDP-glucose 4-epimerase
MAFMITGGAGYIGAHVARLLSGRGDVLVVDDLSTGRRERVPGLPLLQLDLGDVSCVGPLTGSMREHDVEAVIHFAARKQVGESALRPAYYYAQNVGGLAHLLMAMEAAGVNKLVFSSSAATYGTPEGVTDGIMRESQRCAPVSAYGETKLISEWLCRDAEAAWGLHWLGLRYFNVAGAGWPELGDPAVLNLIPIVLSDITNGRQPKVFGDDYETRDGTCVRDYVHVLDLSEAHIAALDGLIANLPGTATRVVNIGTGTGSTVLEVLAAVATATGHDFSPEVVARRRGDPPVLVADVQLAADVLGWRGRLGLADMVASAWEAWQYAPPRGRP